MIYLFPATIWHIYGNIRTSNNNMIDSNLENSNHPLSSPWIVAGTLLSQRFFGPMLRFTRADSQAAKSHLQNWKSKSHTNHHHPYRRRTCQDKLRKCRRLLRSRFSLESEAISLSLLSAHPGLPVARTHSTSGHIDSRSKTQLRRWRGGLWNTRMYWHRNTTCPSSVASPLMAWPQFKSHPYIFPCRRRTLSFVLGDLTSHISLCI